MCAKAEACFKLKLRDKQIGLFHKRLRVCLSVKYPGGGNLPRTISLMVIVLCDPGKCPWPSEPGDQRVSPAGSKKSRWTGPV